MTISISEVAARLGISLDYTPAVGCLWDGKAVHTSIAVEVIRELGLEDCYKPKWGLFGTPFHWMPWYESTSYPGEFVIGYRIKQLDDYALFHELAHYLMCPVPRLSKKDFGFSWCPEDTSVIHHSNQECTRAEDWEEEAVDTLSLFMMLACGYNEETTLGLFASFNKPDVWVRGIQHPGIFEAWDLFRLLMGF